MNIFELVSLTEANTLIEFYNQVFLLEEYSGYFCIKTIHEEKEFRIVECAINGNIMPQGQEFVMSHKELLRAKPFHCPIIYKDGKLQKRDF